MRANRLKTDGVFSRARRRAFRLSSDSCVKCGNLAREAHHVYGPEDNDPAHVRPLCRWCHCIAPMGHAYWLWERFGESGMARLIRECRPRLDLASCPDGERLFVGMVRALGAFGVRLTG